MKNILLPFRFVLTLLRSELSLTQIFCLAGLMITSATFDIFGLFLIFGYINWALHPADTGGLMLGPINFTSYNAFFDGSVIVACIWLFVVLKCIVTLTTHYLTSLLTLKMYQNISSKLAHNYLRQPYEFHLTHTSANLIQNVASTAIMWPFVVFPALTIFSEGLTFISFLCILAGLYPIPALLAVTAALIVGFSLFAILKPRITRQGEQATVATNEANILIHDGLSSIREMKVYGGESYFDREYHKQVSLIARPQAFLYVAQRFTHPTIEFILLSLVLAGAALLRVEPHESAKHIPMLVIMLVAALRLLPGFIRITNSFITIKFDQTRAMTLANDLLLPVENTQNWETAEDFALIELRNVSYTYPNRNEPALRNISLKIEKGESIAITGRSGAGKSTLVDVLLGLISPTTGQVLFDGRGGSVHRHVRAAYVPQAFFISNNTLLNNIVFGGDKTEVDPLRLEKAIRSAHLEEVIAKMPLGLNTPCGERGIHLAGGERQRVAIARALYHEPHLIILDEATSALDEEAASYISRTITELQGKITSIVISHDRRLFKKCDRIITLEAGGIISEERPGNETAAGENN